MHDSLNNSCGLGLAVNELTLVLRPDVELAVIPDNTAFLVVSITINEVRNLYVMQLNLHFLLLIKTLPKGQYDLPFLVYAISQRPL
jgi:hypothetical protein